MEHPALLYGAAGPGSLECPDVHATGGTPIDYETHGLLAKFCLLLVFAGVLMLITGHGWLPLVTYVLAGIAVSAFAGRFLTRR